MTSLVQEDPVRHHLLRRADQPGGERWRGTGECC